MNAEHNPQAEQMGDASMARNLRYQAEAIWPQERPLFDRYGLAGALRIRTIPRLEVPVIVALDEPQPTTGQGQAVVLVFRQIPVEVR